MSPPDPSIHASLSVLQAGLLALPTAPTDEGRVALMVRRPAPEQRETPSQVLLTPERGLSGDEWERRLPRDIDAQLAVMQLEVARLIANGQPLTMFGDNLIVDLDLSTSNLPAGSRLRVGEATVEVTAKPHNGCAKFHARFGADALRFVAAPPTRHRNLRGVYWKVLEAGNVTTQSTIRVLSRG